MTSPTVKTRPKHGFILRYLLLLSLPLLLMTASSFYLFAIKQQNVVRDRMEFFNSSTAQQWENALSSVEEQINILAADLAAYDGMLSPEMKARHNSVWQQLSRSGSLLKGLYYVQRDNSLVSFNHLVPPPAKTIVKQQWYQDAIHTPGINTWSAPYLDNVQHIPVITLSRAVLNRQGKVVAVVAIDFELAKVSDRIGSMLLGGKQMVYLLYDRQHKLIVAHSNPQLNTTPLDEPWLPGLRGRNGTLETPDGELIAYYTLHNNPNWQVITVFPFSNSFVIQELLPTMMLGLLLSFAIYILVAIIFHQRLENTISMLVQVVRLLRVTPTGEPITIPKIPGIEELEGEITMISDQMQAESEKAQRDALTELYNRRYMDTQLAELYQQHTPYVLAIIDIDNFKQINDKYGHPTGDSVLKRTASLGSRLLEGQATLCRFGGEEMVAIFEQGELTHVQQLMEQWRLAMSKQNWREPGLTVTFSGGLAEALDASPAQVLAQADAALYRAKQEGKDRLCLA
ncbi:diguanylate cyclase [Aeromonas jandaei]|uniref:sensor domain-containing diguanylate cyclase n=1 Tax=Aeromonas jandaei TaxID=650 RepID=UPI0019349A89|nr:sensor domain-containing diguanylate cyclase [Aeromonas jandaei]MBM0489898.1 diguanylate cyclase [Aeromonas jandaei]MBM0567394.1 diguanylate cyclase [Aeromonas jandaei]